MQTNGQHNAKELQQPCKEETKGTGQEGEARSTEFVSGVLSQIPQGELEQSAREQTICIERLLTFQLQHQLFRIERSRSRQIKSAVLIKEYDSYPEFFEDALKSEELIVSAFLLVCSLK